MRTDLSNYLYGLYFTRYNTLNDLVNDGFSNISGNNIDIYIDLASVFRSILDNTNIRVTSSLDITSVVMNMAIHYSYFFKRYIGINTRCFMISSYDGIYRHQINTLPSYNEKYIMRQSTNINTKYVKDNIEILESIIPYFPGIYYIDSTRYESASVILNLINRYNNPSLVISRDILNAQTVSNHDKTMMIYPSKQYGEDTSLSITPDNTILDFLIMYSSIKNNSMMDALTNENTTSSLKPYVSKINDIYPECIPLIMAMSGYNKRNIPSIVNYPNTIKYIIDAVQIYMLPKQFDKFQISPFLERSNRVDSEDILKIISNYNALNILEDSIRLNDSKLVKKNHLVDLYDIDSVKKINDIYFKNNPIDINRL